MKTLKTASFTALLYTAMTQGAYAQFGDRGHVLPTTPAQQTAIDQAVAFLQSVGEDTSGLSITNCDANGNTAALAAPGHVGIDFGRLDEVVDPNTPGAPGHPGLVVIVLFHELQHLNHGWGNDPCSEINLAVSVAGKHCEFINFVWAGGGGPLDALCDMYNHVQAKVGSQETQDAFEDNNCAGPAPAIPDCKDSNNQALCPH
jgi:hypothetical protein